MSFRKCSTPTNRRIPPLQDAADALDVLSKPPPKARRRRPALPPATNSQDRPHHRAIALARRIFPGVPWISTTVSYTGVRDGTDLKRAAVFRSGDAVLYVGCWRWNSRRKYLGRLGVFLGVECPALGQGGVLVCHGGLRGWRCVGCCCWGGV